MRRRRLLAGAALAALAAAGAPAPGAPAFRFGGPEVAKLDWNTRALVAADLDGDGKGDLAVLNNDRARIELLYQQKPGEAAPAGRRVVSRDRWEPVLEDARLRKASVVTGIAMFDLAAGDLDGDGRCDLVYTGNPDDLTIRYQRTPGDFARKRVFDLKESPAQRGDTIRIADVNGDKRLDLAMLAQSAILLFTQNEKGELVGPDPYALSDEGGYDLEVQDANRDGRPDLVWLAPNSREPLRIRFGLPKGGFGPERAFRTEPPRGEVRPIRLGEGAAPAFVHIQAQTGLLEVFTLAPPEAEDQRALNLRVYATRAGGKAPAAWALADFDGDKRLDLAASDGDGAQVLLFLQQADGEFGEPLKFPSLADVRGIAAADADGDGRAELFSMSPKERVIGLSGFSKEGRLEYPKTLPTSGKPLAIAAADLDGDGRPEVAYVQEEKGKRAVSILAWGKDAPAWAAKASVELTGLKTDPRAARVLDANRDGRPDLAVFTVQEPMRLLLQKEDGSFAEAQAAAGFRKGLVDNLDPAALTLGDLDGDGKPEILVAGTGYARSLRLDGGGTLEVSDQFNARESDAEIACAVPVDIDGDKVPEILLAEKKGGAVQLLKRDARGVYRYAEAFETSKIDLVGTEVLDLDGNGAPDVLFLGKDRFWRMPVGRPDLAPKSLATYETDLKDVTYVDVAVADLNGDGAEDLALVDTRDAHLLEILSRDGAGAWKSALHFTIFEVDPHYQGRRGGGLEPREILLPDATGDGKRDLVFLAHDRLLLYPQE